MNIGQAAHFSGLSVKTIRYYEDTGLIPAVGRTRVGYRSYNEKDVHTLRFIAHARRLGISVRDIRRLLNLWQDRNSSSAEVRELCLAHLTILDRKLVTLQDMQKALQLLVANCEGDARPDFPILNELDL